MNIPFTDNDVQHSRMIDPFTAAVCNFFSGYYCAAQSSSFPIILSFVFRNAAQKIIVWNWNDCSWYTFCRRFKSFLNVKLQFNTEIQQFKLELEFYFTNRSFFLATKVKVSIYILYSCIKLKQNIVNSIMLIVKCTAAGCEIILAVHEIKRAISEIISTEGHFF